jgi:phosphate transport system protein
VDCRIPAAQVAQQESDASMTVHLNRQLDVIKKGILNLGAMVEESLKQAIKSVETRDLDLAREISDRDRDIDLAEIDLEEECLKTLALHQPVATDLRFIIAVLKMNHDLERIGDLAVDISSEAIELARLDVIDISQFHLDEMFRHAQVMLKRSLDALVQHDADLAQSVRDEDDQVDMLDRSLVKDIEDLGQGKPGNFRQYVCVLSVSRHIERIADHAVNIAKDVIYMVKGNIVRHSSKRAT